MDPDRWTLTDSDDRQQEEQQQQQQQQQRQGQSPPRSLSPLLQLGRSAGLLSPVGLQTALLAQLTAQHASQLQYQQALLTWARLVTGLPPPPPLLTDPAETAADRTAAAPPAPGGSASSGSPPRSDGSPPSGRRPPAREKVFPCPICHRLFGYKHVLQNHVRTHTGEKPFQCTECHKRFTRDHHLKTHMRLHTGEKPYQCEHCARRFVQVANLRRHQRVHTGERPHGCRHCTARFSDTNQLKNHQLVHTGQKTFGCAVCGADFRRRYQLAQHRCVPPPPPVGLSVAVAEEARRIGRTLSEKLRLERTAALGAAALKTEPPDTEPEVVEVAGPVIGQAFSLGTGLGQTLLPGDTSQTEPEDLSVPASSRWSSGSLDDRRNSSASLDDQHHSSNGRRYSSTSLLSQTGGTAARNSPDSAEKTSRQRWSSSSTEHGQDNRRRGDSQRSGKNNGNFIPWWSIREHQSPKSGFESESRKRSTSPRRLPASGWPLHPGQQEQVTVFPERQHISVRRWEQLARAGSDRSGVVQTTSDQSAGATADQTADRADNPRRPDHQEPRASAERSWPWNLSLAAAERCLLGKEVDDSRNRPEKETVTLHYFPEKDRGDRGQDTSSSSPEVTLLCHKVSTSPEVTVIDCISSDEEDEKQKKENSLDRYRTVADAGDRTEPDSELASGRDRRTLPPLVPLGTPLQSSDPRPPQQDTRKAAERDKDSALRAILMTKSSPPHPPAGYPWSQRRVSSQGYNGAAELNRVTEKTQHREVRENHRSEQDVGGTNSWDTKKDNSFWENTDDKYYLSDSVEIKLWEGV